MIGVDSFTSYYARERKLRNLARTAEEEAFWLVEGDLLELNLEELLRGASSIVHLAAEPEVRVSWGDNFSQYLERNVDATQRLLEALPERGLERFVFASSSLVYGAVEEEPVKEDSWRRPTSPYGLSKLAAEELAGLYGWERGVPATILRYFTVYDLRQCPEMALSRFISLAVQGEALQVFGNGNQTREMTYVSDVVEATVAALGALPGGPYNVGGTRVTANEFIGQVQDALGIQVKVTYGPAVAEDVHSTWADLERVGRELCRPRVSLEKGIKAQVEWTFEEELASSPVGGRPDFLGVRRSR